MTQLHLTARLLPALILLASCTTPEPQRVPPPGVSAAGQAPAAKAETRPKAAQEPAAKPTEPGSPVKAAKMPETAAPSAVLTVAEIQSIAEQQVLCTRYVGPSALEDMMRQANLIPSANPAKAAKKPGTSATYRMAKPFRFLGLPVSSVSFSGNGDPKKAAFWMTVDAPVKSTAAAVSSRDIALKKDVRLGYVYASETKRGQRVEVHALPKQSMVLCARSARD